LNRLIYPYIREKIDAQYDIYNLLKHEEIYDYASEMAFQHLKLMYDITQREKGKIMLLLDLFVYCSDMEENVTGFTCQMNMVTFKTGLY